MLRNSGFWFAQRQAPASTTVYDSSTDRLISADGWGISCANTAVTYARTDTIAAPEVNLQSRYYGRFVKVTSTGKMEITQGVEGTDTSNVRGRTVRVQIQMRGLVAASALWNVGLVQNIGATVDPFTSANFFSSQNANGTDPTLTADYVYIAPNGAFPADGGVIVGNKIQAAITNSPTWVRVGGCFDVPTTAKNLYVMIWSDSGVVAPTNGIALGQAFLVDSTAIQPWAALPIEEEFARVQRYYSKSFNVDQLPTSALSAGRVLGSVSAAGATANRMMLRYQVALLRTNSTPTLFNPTNAGAQVTNTVTGDDATATTAVATAANGCEITFTGQAAWVVGQPVAIQFTVDSEV